ncbi:MAG TPA: GDP-L-fucose synthase [Nitrospirales bacterium]|nr:GDP-L-fucose synthase [Nitrospirales bacterium]
MEPKSKIYIAGHTGMMGSAFLRQLQARGQANIVTRTHRELDLTNQAAVNAFFEKEKPEYVLVAAAKVGGIMANATYPADFIYLNLAMQTNIIHAAYLSGVKRLLFLGSVCIYPKHCPQPIKEDYLLTGALEPTNEPYAIAKIAGMKMCEAYNRQYGTQYLCAMPTNLYGTGDNFDLETSHVLPALIRKFHESKMHGTSVTLWGTGQASREFLHVDDCANACIFLMDLNPERFQTLLDYPAGPLVNIGSGEDISILDLAGMIQKLIGASGQINWDSSKPDGTPKRKLDITRLDALGWQPRISLANGIKMTYDWYLQHDKSPKLMEAPS